MRRRSTSQNFAGLLGGLAALACVSSAAAAQDNPEAAACAASLQQDLSALGWTVRVEHEVPPHVQSVVDHVCAQRRETRADVWVALDETRGHVEAPFLQYRQARELIRRSLAAEAPLCALGEELVRASRRHQLLRWSLLAGFLLGGLAFALLFRRAVRWARLEGEVER